MRLYGLNFAGLFLLHNGGRHWNLRIDFGMRWNFNLNILVHLSFVHLYVFLKGVAISVGLLAEGARVDAALLMDSHVLLYEVIGARLMATNGTHKRLGAGMDHHVAIPLVPPTESLIAELTLEGLLGVQEMHHFVFFQCFGCGAAKIALVAGKPLHQFGRCVLAGNVIAQRLRILEAARTLSACVSIVARVHAIVVFGEFVLSRVFLVVRTQVTEEAPKGSCVVGFHVIAKAVLCRVLFLANVTTVGLGILVANQVILEFSLSAKKNFPLNGSNCLS